MFDTHQILNLVGQLGGDHQQAAQQFAGQSQVDPAQSGGLLQKFGVDPQQLQNGGYDQHLQAQQQPGFGGYQPGQDPAQQQPQFEGSPQGGGQQGGGQEYQQGGGQEYQQGGGQDYQQGGGQEYQQGGGQDDQQGGTQGY